MAVLYFKVWSVSMSLGENKSIFDHNFKNSEKDMSETGTKVGFLLLIFYAFVSNTMLAMWNVEL